MKKLKYLISGYPFFWLLSAVPAWGGVALLVSLKDLYKNRRDLVIIYFAFGFLIQIISISYSVFLDVYQFMRMIGMVHNLIVYLLIVCGVVYSYSFRMDDLISFFTKTSILLASLVVLVFFVHLLSGQENAYSLPWGNVVFSRAGYILGFTYPRVSIFAPYVNALGLMAVIIYGIVSLSYISGYITLKKTFVIGVAMFFVAVMAGSRTGVLIIAVLFYMNIAYKMKIVGLILSVLVISTLLVFSYYNDLISLLLEARAGSTDTRLALYLFSLDLVLEYSPVVGLGQKPFIQFSIPIGSHSTYIGYVVKNGLLGLIFVVFGFAFIFIDLLLSIIRGCSYRVYTSIVILLVMASLMTEDIDAFELNALLFGILVGLYFIERKRKGLNEKYTPNYIKK